MTYLNKNKGIAILLLVVLILTSVSIPVDAESSLAPNESDDNFIIVIWNKILDFFSSLGKDTASVDKEKEIKNPLPRLDESGILIGEDTKVNSENFTGQGKHIEFDGSVYEGDFVENSREGTGKVVSVQGKTIYEGDWKEDDMSGEGKLYLDDNSYFEGSIEASQPVDGRYVVKSNDSEVVNEIKDGHYAVQDLSSDGALKKQIQNIMNEAFVWYGFPENDPFTERDIIIGFVNYDKGQEFIDYSDNINSWFKVSESEVNKHSMKYFGRNLNGNSHTTKYFTPDDVWGYYYKDNNYYFGFLPTGFESTIITVNNIYKTNDQTLFAVVDTGYVPLGEENLKYTGTRLVELNQKDGRYILVGNKEVKRNHQVTQGYKINQDNLPITTLSQKPQKKKEFLTDKTKTDLFFKQMKETYSTIDKADKTNNRALNIISNDVDKHIESLFSTNLKISDQQIKITKQSLANHLETLDQYKEGINQYTLGINQTLKQAGINLKRQPLRTIVVNFDEYPHKDNFSFYLASDMKEYLTDLDKIIFNLSGFRLTFDAKTLADQLEDGDLLVDISNEGGAYNIIFKDANGNIKDSIKAKISFNFPLEGKPENKSVHYTSTKNHIEDNIGGKYDKTNKTIEIQTKSPGRFEIKENAKTSFIDLEKQDQETKDAIKNLVSKGIMEGKTNDEFRPDEIMTREEFAMSMVKTFYELDGSAKTSFTDVSEKDNYYLYIASSEKENLVKGYPDQTFKGKDPITKEDVISITSRGLHEKKKYIYPENPKDLLKFRDKEKILTYAQKEVALAVREGIIENNKKNFQPQSSMTRAETALIINRLINKLY